MSEQAGRERVGMVLFYGLMILLVYAVYRVLEPFLVPLGWAVVLLVVFHPMHARLEQRMRPSRAAAVSTLAIAMILVVPAVLLLAAFVNEGVGAVGRLRENIASGKFTQLDEARAWVQRHLPAAAQLDLAQVVREGVERVATFFASRAGSVLRNVALFFFDLFVMLFALFFLFRDRTSIFEGVRRLLPFEEAQINDLTSQAQELIQTSVTASFIIAAVQGLLGGITFALVGIDGAIFWGVTMAFFALIPLMGTGIVIAPAAAYLLLTGSVTQGILLAVVGFGAIGTVDNVLRPFLVGGRTQMSALGLFISVMGGIGAFGMLGLVLGPIVLATARSLLNVYGWQSPHKPSVQPSDLRPAAESARPAPQPVLELAAPEAEKKPENNEDAQEKA